LVSSVLFLTESGGPTLVLDQDPQGPLAPRGWLVQPCPNQLLAFKGNLLHGVIPGRHHLLPAICMTPVPCWNILLVYLLLQIAFCHAFNSPRNAESSFRLRACLDRQSHLKYGVVCDTLLMP